ncbi:MAG: hypothetical protein WA160_14755 [Pseudobdellovibrio sp.]
MSKDRYRPLFCKPDYYLAHQTIFKMWKTNFSSFSDVEKIKVWTVGLSCLRRPNDWFGGMRPIFFESNDGFEKSSIKIKDLFFNTAIKWPLQIDPNIDLQSFLNYCRIKPLPESALRSLYKLGSNDYPLIITEHEPEPFELLNIQIHGKRVITFIENYQLWPEKTYGERDILSFIIHDLIHADHFFKDPIQRKGQIGFYKLIEKIQTDFELLSLLKNAKFKSGFEYIISDMNSHPVHLLQTLKALLFLATLNDQKATAIWNLWVSTWSHDQNDRDAVQKVNTQLFSNIHANQIENMCFKEIS